MDNTQIEMLNKIVEIIKTLGSEGKEAFIWYLLITNMWGYIFGGVWAYILGSCFFRLISLLKYYLQNNKYY